MELFLIIFGRVQCEVDLLMLMSCCLFKFGGLLCFLSSRSTTWQKLTEKGDQRRGTERS